MLDTPPTQAMKDLDKKKHLSYMDKRIDKITIDRKINKTGQGRQE